MLELLFLLNALSRPPKIINEAKPAFDSPRVTVFVRRRVSHPPYAAAVDGAGERGEEENKTAERKAWLCEKMEKELAEFLADFEEYALYARRYEFAARDNMNVASDKDGSDALDADNAEKREEQSDDEHSSNKGEDDEPIVIQPDISEEKR